MPKVSIIVPAYNAENTIERCVRSILDQEFDDFELLLMDDGSTDSTPAIVDRLAAGDPRVVVVHKSNSGVSDTRNQALDRARGTWLQFLDADDWISPEATKLLVRSAEANDADLVISDFYRVIGERVARKGDIDAEGVLTREQFGDYMLENPADFYYGVLWNKLYRRSIVEDNALRMDVSISWCEDFIFNLEYALHAKRIYPLHVPIYYYVRTEGSLASQGTSISNSVRMKLTVIEYYNDFYKNAYTEKDYKARQLDIARFYVQFAGDNAILPWQKATRLGLERTPAYVNPALGDSLLAATYLDARLLDRCLDTVAQRFDLTLKEVRLIAFAAAVEEAGGSFQGRAELADYVGVSTIALAATLQKMILKGLLAAKEVPSDGATAGSAPGASGTGAKPADKTADKRLSIQLTDDSRPIAAEVKTALADYERLRLDGVDSDDAKAWKRVSTASIANERRVLA